MDIQQHTQCNLSNETTVSYYLSITTTCLSSQLKEKRHIVLHLSNEQLTWSDLSAPNVTPSDRGHCSCIMECATHKEHCIRSLQLRRETRQQSD